MIYKNVIDWKIMSSGLNAEISNGIILYGASGSGERILLLMNELGLSDKVIAVVDSNEKKWGDNWLGYKISNPKLINNISNKAIIVIASVYLDEIFQYLNNELKCLQKICSRFSLIHAIHYDIMNNKTNYINSEIVKKYKLKYNLWKYNEKKVFNIMIQKYFTDIIRTIMINKESILLCGIQKVGNTSLSVSFDINKINKQLNNVIFTRHLLYYDKCSFKKIKYILEIFNNNHIKIISGVRKPIERIISQKWQKTGRPYLNDDICISSIVDSSYEKYNMNLKIEEKLGEMEDFGVYADVVDWFKVYIEKLFKIDVFKYPFNKEKGYSIITKNNISIFIYRLDKLSKLEKEIGEFIGDNSFVLKKENIASEKKYKFAYKQYLEQVRIKKEFFDSLVNSKGMNHFYTDKECKEYLDECKDRLIKK